MINQWQVTPHIFWHGTKASIFIIDEANELNALKRKPDGHDALHNLFKWLHGHEYERAELLPCYLVK